MTPEQDINETIHRRKATREERRRKAEQERRKMKLRLLAVTFVIVAVVGVVALFSLKDGIFGAEESTLPPQTQTESVSAAETAPETTAPSETQSDDGQTDPTGLMAAETVPETTQAASKSTKPSEETKKKEEFTVIHIAAAGDVNVTPEMLANAQTPDGYDFTEAFRDVSPVMSSADLTLLNLEGTFAGEPYGDERSSAPAELAAALKTIGVDAIQTANSASIRAGILGLQSTIDTLYGAGIVPVGTFYDSDAYRSSGGYTIVEVQGLRIALVGFTKGMDNLGLPKGSEDCVNVLYEDYTTIYEKVDSDRIKKVLRRVEEEKPDLTIAMLHWGSEYNEDISESQKSIRKLMLNNGVDVILGTHSHLVQTIDYNPDASTLVAYSLGDFFGNADQPGTNYSLVLDIEVTRDNLTGDVRITDYTYTPIFTLKPEDSAAGGHRVVRLQDAMSRYETNYLGKITPDIYDSMTRALKRLDERTHKELK